MYSGLAASRSREKEDRDERATLGSFRGHEPAPRSKTFLTGEARLKFDFFILENGRLFPKVAPSHHRPGGGGEVAVRREISLRNFPPGDYELRARITDETTGAVGERESSSPVRGR